MKSIFITILFMFILAGCGESGTEPNNSKNEIWPLSVGNSWTYSVFYYSSSNKDSLRHTVENSIKVTGKVILNGEIWYEVSFNGKTSRTAMLNREDGLYFTENLNNNGYNPDSAKLALKYPVILNEIFPPSDSNGLLVKNLNKEITTKIGKFNCIQYTKLKYKNLDNSGYFCAPGIGEIKTEQITNINYSTAIPDTAWIITELIEYNINRKK